MKKLALPDSIVAALALLAVLNLLFFPVIWSDRTLLNSSVDAASLVAAGAVKRETTGNIRLPRSNDMGAPSWFAEPSYALLHNELLNDHVFPLWNPYNGFGVPLLANMQSQPLNPVAWVASLFPSARMADLYVLLRLFLAGWLMYFYLRRFLMQIPALCGGLAFMLSGYFIIYINMPEISVSMWMPLLLIGIEMLVHQISFKAIACTAIATALVACGGMPEVCFLVLLFGALYAKIRTLATKRGYLPYFKVLAAFTAATLIGVCLAGPQLLPFVEYMRESFNAHESRHRLASAAAAGIPGLPGLPGLVHHTDFAFHFLTYLAPLAYGPIKGHWLRPGVKFFGLHGYWGAVAVAMALLAAAHALYYLPAALKERFARSGPPQSARESQSSNDQGFEAIAIGFAGLPISLPLFYCFVLLFFQMKRFGHPLVNWIGGLPVLQLILFWKYGEPLMALAVAALAATGLHLVLSRTVKKRIVVACLALILVAGLALMNADLREIVDWRHAQHMYMEIFSAALGLALIAYVLSLSSLMQPRFRHLFAGAVGLLLVGELSFNFLVPEFYKFCKLPERACSAYRGSRYIDFLKSHLASQERLLGFDGVLFPNWSSAFSLFDVRDLDALYPERYLSFVRNFCVSDPEKERGFNDNNLTTRFNGTEKEADPRYSEVPPWLLRRFWSLSSIRFLLSEKELAVAPPTKLTREILEQNQGRDLDFVRLAQFKAGDREQCVLLQHPYGPEEPNLLSVETVVPNDRPWLVFEMAMDESMYRPAGNRGDGVDFNISIETADGAKTGLFSRYIDPKSDPKQRSWLPGSVDLSRYRGVKVKLLFSVDCGHARNSSYDQAGWAGLRFAAGAEPAPQPAEEPMPLMRVYDDQVKIYHLPKPLSRATLFHVTEIVKDKSEVLRSLREESFDVRDAVLLEARELSDRGSAGRQALETVGQIVVSGLSQASEPQRILSYSPSHVVVETDSQLPGVLLLNDTWFPGWKATVDGKECKIWHGDYLFRAVPVEAGRHRVEFTYRPASFLTGVWLFFCGAVMLGAVYSFLRPKKA